MRGTYRFGVLDDEWYHAVGLPSRSVHPGAVSLPRPNDDRVTPGTMHVDLISTTIEIEDSTIRESPGAIREQVREYARSKINAYRSRRH